ncbi:hypothetical protein GE09DRAFT_1007573 [Coniochaeta sp. 2T2.1]|nr:hypothetical protein GE09DRAFT_1007573 [Coniochaeta sp. 2T2.1]
MENEATNNESGRSGDDSPFCGRLALRHLLRRGQNRRAWATVLWVRGIWMAAFFLWHWHSHDMALGLALGCVYFTGRTRQVLPLALVQRVLGCCVTGTAHAGFGLRDSSA